MQQELHCKKVCTRVDFCVHRVAACTIKWPFFKKWHFDDRAGWTWRCAVGGWQVASPILVAGTRQFKRLQSAETAYADAYAKMNQGTGPFASKDKGGGDH